MTCCAHAVLDVVRGVPNHDRLVAESVAQAGFETFVPKIRTRVESRWRTVPLFPGDLFDRIVDRWRVLERTMAVPAAPGSATGSHAPESTELPRLLRWRSRLAPQRVAGRIEVLPGYLQTF